MGVVRGTVYERTEGGSIGQSIAGAEITFRSEAGDVVRSIRSDPDGSYGIELPAARYVASATHTGHKDFSTAPGFVVVDDSGVQTFNVFMKPGGESEPTGPAVTDFSPVSGHGGTKLTITGTGFSAVRGDNEVTVGGESATVISASSTKLVVLVANDARTGPVAVTVDGATGTGPQDFTVLPYPAPDSKDDGPPIHFAGSGQPGGGSGAGGTGAGSAPGISASGQTNVLVSLVRPSDVTPSSPTTARNQIVDKWDTVETFYDQASYGDLDVQVTITNDWHELSGDEDTYVDYRSDPESDDWWESNVRPNVMGRLNAEAAQAAEDEGNSVDDFDAFVTTLFLDGEFIRAWNTGKTENFSYSDASNDVDIEISLSDSVNTMILQETADWGRCAHELAHGLVNAPENLDAAGNQVLREDIYASDLVDGSQASAQRFDMMGAHDTHPLFSAFFMLQLGWYDEANSEHVRSVEWDKNATSHTFEVVAHGDTTNTDPNRCHVVEIEVSSGLSYFVEVRQRPGGGSQVFDDNIPLDGASNQGGVVVTKVLTDQVESNQQMRFLTLLHDAQDVHVLEEGDTAVDPARDLEIEVTTHGVESRPLVCEVSVEWAQNIDPDPDSNFNLTIEPWNTDDWETPDIWLDRKPYGRFDKDRDSEGRPKDNGDKPLPVQNVDSGEKDKALHRFTARIENEGSEKAENVKATYYTVKPPGVGDNGNWAPLKTVTINEIPGDDYVEEWVDWVPAVGEHTCLKVEISEQKGEKSFGKNSAQENIFEFEAPAESVPQIVTMEAAVRNPLDREALVYLTARNVPAGYVVHFPHQWLWLDAKEERTHEVTVVPTEDYNWFQDSLRENMTASIRLDGAVARHYTQEVSPGTVPPSWLEPIGGVTTNVTPKRTVDLELDVKERNEETVVLTGVMTPAMDDEQVSVGVRDPRDRWQIAETTTDSSGRFEVLMNLSEPVEGRLGEQRETLLSGTYRGQAFTINAANAAETESNVVHFDMSKEAEVDSPVISPPEEILEIIEDFTTTVEEFVTGVFTELTGGDRRPDHGDERSESESRDQ